MNHGAARRFFTFSLFLGAAAAACGCGKAEHRKPDPAAVSAPAARTGGPAFAEKTFEFSIDRDFEQRRAVRVANPGVEAASVVLAAAGEFEDLFLGFVWPGSPERPLLLEPGDEKQVEIVFFAQDALKEEYRIPIELTGASPGCEPLGRAQISLRVRKPRFDLDVTFGEPDPATLATAIRIRNRGDSLSDLSIRAGKGLEGRILFSPQAGHARLESGGLFMSLASPLLKPGDRGFEGEIVLEAAGSQKSVPLAFTVPKGKQVFFGLARSTRQSAAKNWFCTNRPRVPTGIQTCGNGPRPSSGSPIEIDPPGSGREGETGPGPGYSPIDNGAGDDPPEAPRDGNLPDNPGRAGLALGDPLMVTGGDGTQRQLSEGDPLYPGDKVSVPPGGLLEIDYGDGALRLGPGEHVLDERAFKEVKQGVISSAWDKVKKLFEHSGSDFSATSGFRGGAVRKPVRSLRPNLEWENAGSPFILFGPGGGAAAWHSCISGSQQVWFSSIRNGKASPVIVTRTAGLSRWPFLAGDRSGRYFLAWEEGKIPEVCFSSSADSGATWSAPARLTEHGKGAFDPVIWASKDGLLVAWEDGRKGVFCRVSKDGGAAFGPETRIAEGAAAWPQIAGRGDRLWAVWTLREASGSSINAAESKDFGATWSAPVRISSGKPAVAGEPSLLAHEDGNLGVAWRDSRDGNSEIYFRSSKGGAWGHEIRVTADEAYSEYPWLYGDGKNLGIRFSTPAAGIDCRAKTASSDNGATWSKPVREQSAGPDVSRCFFVTDFSLPWDRAAYRKHSVKMSVNGILVGRLEDTIPEGRYLFQFSPRALNYSPGETASNEVLLDTEHLNGGHYVVNSDFKIVQEVTHTERAVLAENQEQADAMAACMHGEGYNHDAPDLGLFTNWIKGMPADRTRPGRVELEVAVINLGAGRARDVKLFAVLGADGSGRVIAGPVIIPAVEACRGRWASLVFEYDGSAFEAALVARGKDPDYNPEDNVWPFTMGSAEKGTIRVEAPAQMQVTAFAQSNGEKAAEFGSGQEALLPVGVYRITASSGGTGHSRDNVAIRGGLETVVDFSGLGAVVVASRVQGAVKVFAGRAAEPVASGAVNQPIALEPGFYKVEFSSTLGAVYVERDVLVQAGKKTAVRPDVALAASTRTRAKDGALLFSDDFADPSAFESGFEIVDCKPSREGPSRWRVTEGELHQDSNIHNPFDEFAVHEGTQAAIRGGEKWQDYEFSADWRVRGDDDGVAFLFRYKDEDRHYRLIFLQDPGNGGPFRRLQAKKGPGKYVTLAETRDGYDRKKKYSTRISVLGARIVVELDGEIIFDLTDGTYDTGGAGLACYAEQPSFSKVRVRAIANFAALRTSGGAVTPVPKIEGMVALDESFDVVFERPGAEVRASVDVPSAGYLQVLFDGAPQGMVVRYGVIAPEGKTILDSHESNAVRAGAGIHVVALREHWDSVFPGSFKARIVFVPEMDAHEPNDRPADAKPVEPGKEIEYSLFPRYDWDYFRVEAPGDGYLAVEHTGPLEGIVYRTWFGDTQGNALQDSHEIAAMRVARGAYVVGWKDHWDGPPEKPRPGKARIVFVPEMDAHEPNDSPEQAAPVKAGGEARIAFYPVKDRDWFSFEAERDGELELVFDGLPEGIVPRIRILDKKENQVFDGLECKIRLEKGAYRIWLMSHWDAEDRRVFGVKFVWR